MIPDINDPTAAAMLAVLMEVGDERFRQEQKFPLQTLPWGGDRKTYEQLANYAREECDDAAANGTLTWVHILKEEVAEAFAEESAVAARAELIQVAAVAVRAIEAIDRVDEEGQAELRYGGGYVPEPMEPIDVSRN